MGEAYQIRNQRALYFLTFRVVGWADIFSRKKFRDILLESMEFCRNKKGLNNHAYVVMTNHVHVIWSAKNADLSDIVRDFKRHTSKEILKELRYGYGESRKDWLELVFQYHAKFNKRNLGWQFWRQHNHAVELATNAMIDQRLNYLHQNPVKEAYVAKAEQYLYSSAANYAGERGLIDVDLLDR